MFILLVIAPFSILLLKSELRTSVTDSVLFRMLSFCMDRCQEKIGNLINFNGVLESMVSHLVFVIKSERYIQSEVMCP